MSFEAAAGTGRVGTAETKSSAMASEWLQLSGLYVNIMKGIWNLPVL